MKSNTILLIKLISLAKLSPFYHGYVIGSIDLSQSQKIHAATINTSNAHSPTNCQAVRILELTSKISGTINENGE